MKNLLSILVLSILFSGLSCTSSTEANNETEKEEVKKVVKEYALVNDNSIISWTRNVDYKHIETQVLMFGAYVDVSMDNVKYETTGEIIPDSGILVTEDGVPVSGEVVLDLSLTRFYSQQEEKFFVNETMPPTKIIFNEFILIEDTDYSVKGDLIMGETVVPLQFPTYLVLNESRYTFTSVIPIQSSQLPILNQPEPENVNMDDITFIMELSFTE